ncbi:MAG: VTT domain-containing protein [Bacteroidales bacterium]|jgi:membrane-associated protein|nr:VTT domain-containing protein [Bacteroidales bacterium]
MEGGFLSFISDPHHIIEYGGLILVLIIIYLETGFFLGFVLPGGDYLVFAAGIFCGTHYLELPLPVLMALMIVASFLGDFTGYHKGKWLGDRFFTDNKSRFFRKEYLERGHSFYTRFGVWAFILGRFMPIIRTLVPMIAGATRFKYRKFLLFNILGALTWIGTLTPLGYFVGKTYPGILKYSAYIIVLFILIASFPMLRIMFRKKKAS